MAEQKCKWLSDDISEVCTNGDCPLCADFCPVTQHPEICKFAEFEGKKRTNADKIRAMTDEELACFMQSDCAKAKFYACRKFRINGCDDRVCEQCWLDWLKKEVEE